MQNCTEELPERNRASGRYTATNPHDPRAQLWALLLLASSHDGECFVNLAEPAQRALLVTAYEKAFAALHPEQIDS